MMVIDDRCDTAGCCTSQSRGNKTRYFARDEKCLAEVLTGELSDDGGYYDHLAEEYSRRRSRFLEKVTERTTKNGGGADQVEEAFDRDVLQIVGPDPADAEDSQLFPDNLRDLVPICEKFLPKSCGCYCVKTTRILVPKDDYTYGDWDLSGLRSNNIMRAS